MAVQKCVAAIIVPPACLLIDRAVVLVGPIVGCKWLVVAVREVVSDNAAAMESCDVQCVAVNRGEDDKVVVKDVLTDTTPIRHENGQLGIS